MGPPRLLARIVLASLLAGAVPAHAAFEGPVAAGLPPDVAYNAEAADAICLLVEAAAIGNGVPTAFFSRLIGQESSFRPQAQGPMTRFGVRAQGIAQFMPGTAAERGLADPFDPVQALPRAAEFLRDLKAAFGNWGLAAAAYNAGPRCIEGVIGGEAFLPAETAAYVIAITDHTVQDWIAARRNGVDLSMAEDANCTQVRQPALSRHDRLPDRAGEARRGGSRQARGRAAERRLLAGRGARCELSIGCSSGPERGS